MVLIRAQHQRIVWWIQVQPDRITRILDEECVDGYLEVAMRAALGDARLSGSK